MPDCVQPFLNPSVLASLDVFVTVSNATFNASACTVLLRGSHMSLSVAQGHVDCFLTVDIASSCRNVNVHVIIPVVTSTV